MYLIHIYVKYYGVCWYIYIYPCCTWIAYRLGKKNTCPCCKNHHEISTQSVVHVETNRDLEFSFHQVVSDGIPPKSPQFPPEKSTKITQKSPRKSPRAREPGDQGWWPPGLPCGGLGLAATAGRGMGWDGDRCEAKYEKHMSSDQKPSFISYTTCYMISFGVL